jgi:hypothetical protein
VSQLFLWADAVSDEPRVRKRKPVRLCSQCKKKLPKKPRSTMPIGHALQTVQGIFIDRLDAMTPDIARIIADEVGERLECDHRVIVSIAGRVVDALNYRFFPEAYADGEPYTPDPAGRMDVPVQPIGLIPPRPTVAILAKHLLALGQQSPAASLTTPDGQPLFTDADLERLGGRIERRGQRTA